MKKNMGNLDRLLRIPLALAFFALYFTETLVGAPGIILLVLGIVLLLTSAWGFCPLYAPLNISTCDKKKPTA